MYARINPGGMGVFEEEKGANGRDERQQDSGHDHKYGLQARAGFGALDLNLILFLHRAHYSASLAGLPIHPGAAWQRTAEAYAWAWNLYTLNHKNTG